MLSLSALTLLGCVTIQTGSDPAKSGESNIPRTVDAKALASDFIAPELSQAKMELGSDDEWIFVAKGSDNLAVESLTLYYNGINETQYNLVTLQPDDSGAFSHVITTKGEPKSINFFIKITDISGNTVQRGQADNPMTTPVILQNQPEETWNGIVSKRGRVSVPLEFRNTLDAELDLVWIDFDGRRKSYGTVAPFGKRSFKSYVDHHWEVIDKASNIVSRFSAKGDRAIAIIN